jgi:putative DNA primase/helicase
MIDELKKQVQERVAEETSGIPEADDGPKIDSKFIQQCLFDNTVGDGMLYATALRNKFVFCKNTGEWYRWDGNYWQRDVMNRSLVAVEVIVPFYLAEYKKVAIQLSEFIAGGEDPKSEQAKKIEKLRDKLLSRANQLRDDKRRTACLKFAHTIENPLAIKGDELDTQPWLFPCKNGVIDLRTGKLKPGRPEDYLSLASPIEFKGVDEPAPIWERSLLEIFNGNQDLVDYLQRLFGYGMTGIVNEKIFPVLHGKTGWNGRSLIVETIAHIMGDLSGAIQSEMMMSQKYGKSSAGPSPDIMALKGVRLAFASEVDENQRFSAARIKWLTGNDTLVGRGLQEKYQTKFTPTHKLILMTNTQPAAPAKDKAFWERMHLIPFEISFVKRDPLEPHERRANLNLANEIKKEYPGILGWLVKGCLLWQQQGINPPTAVIEASNKYRQNEDMMGDFIEECCEKEPAAKVQASVIYNTFLEWYHANIGKGDKLTGSWFGKQFNHYFEKTKINGCNYYLGVDVKSGTGHTETIL